MLAGDDSRCEMSRRPTNGRAPSSMVQQEHQLSQRPPDRCLWRAPIGTPARQIFLYGVQQDNATFRAVNCTDRRQLMKIFTDDDHARRGLFGRRPAFAPRRRARRVAVSVPGSMDQRRGRRLLLPCYTYAGGCRWSKRSSERCRVSIINTMSLPQPGFRPAGVNAGLHFNMAWCLARKLVN